MRYALAFVSAVVFLPLMAQSTVNGSTVNLSIPATTCTNQVVSAISSTGAGTCHSITTGDLPIITLAGGGLNANLTAVNGGIFYSTASAGAILAAGTSKQMFVSGGAGAPSWIDYPDVHYFQAANCVNAVAGSGFSIPATAFVPTCTGVDTNSVASLRATPNVGATAYFQWQLPSDWDTATQPYMKIYYGSGSNASGTVIWTVSTACTKSDGSVSDNPAYVAESAMATQTMTTANRMWAQSAQFANLTSGNNCIAGSIVDVKVVLSGTASTGNIGLYYISMTTPRLPAVAAN